MAKSKTPFLSLHSSGTVGGVLTSQKRGRDTILRATPTPTDPYSLAQAYQRWLYRDYTLWWSKQSEATKQTYRTNASRYHITGFSLWMREHLRTLSDIVGYWKLDDNTGAFTIDSSKNANPGTIIGASPATGLIDQCLLFDGLNDLVNCGHDPSLNLGSDDFTIECLFQTTNPWGDLIHKGQTGAGAKRYRLWLQNTKLRIEIDDNVAEKAISSTLAYNDGDWHHAQGRRDGTDLRLLIDGVEDPNSPLNIGAGYGSLDSPTHPLIIGRHSAQAIRYWDGLIDHVLIRNRAVASKYYERSYPPQ